MQMQLIGYSGLEAQVNGIYSEINVKLYGQKKGVLMSCYWSIACSVQCVAHCRVCLYWPAGGATAAENCKVLMFRTALSRSCRWQRFACY